MSAFWKQAYPGLKLTENVMQMEVEHPDIYGDLAPLRVIVHILPYGIRVDGELYGSRLPQFYFPPITKVIVDDRYCTFELGGDTEHFIQAKVEDEGLIIDHWRGCEVVETYSWLWDDFLEQEDDDAY